MDPSSTREPKPIGGFFEPERQQPRIPAHGDAIALSTGRSCLCAILDFLKPTRCYVPHFTCDATLAPFEQRQIEVLFFELDADLQPRQYPKLQQGECFLFTNYWGLQRKLAAQVSEQYGERLIVDDTHDFHSARRYPRSWSFTSARKYFGVPDGAFLYTPDGIDANQVVHPSTPEFQAVSVAHSVSRALGRQEQAFAEYQAYELSLPCELFRISSYSRALLAALDFDAARARRRENFETLARALGEHNSLDVPDDPELTPFVYPFLPATPIAHADYHRQRIFVPTYWPDVLARPSVSCTTALEYTRKLIPFPIDHRYGGAEMQRIIDVTKDLLDEQ